MFFASGFFWMLMGVLLVLVAAGFRAFAHERGWVITWWKGLLALIWYGIFTLSFFAYGTLAGENEAGAGFRVLLLGLFVSLVLGVGLWRVLAARPKARGLEA